MYSDSVFLWIPKTGGTSLAEALALRQFLNAPRVEQDFDQQGHVTFGHIDYRLLVQAGDVSEEFDNAAFKYAIVRNPYDRMVSLWCYLRRSEMTFTQFCRKVEEGIPPIGYYNETGLSQCNPQVDWIRGLSIGYWGRFECLHRAARTCGGIMGINRVILPHRNKSPERWQYQNYYDDETRAIVERVYEEDFENFGYEF